MSQLVSQLFACVHVHEPALHFMRGIFQRKHEKIHIYIPLGATAPARHLLKKADMEKYTVYICHLRQKRA